MKFLLGGDGPVSPKDRAEQEQWQERIRQDADPGVLARVSRIEHHPMLAPLRPLPQAIRPMTTRFDDPLRQWHVGFLQVSDEIELPYELQRDLRECVPQSILRDVFRPTPSFDPSREPLDIEQDRTGARALAEAKAALQREPMPTIESSLLVIRSEQRRYKRFLRTPWPTMLTDNQPRQYYEEEGVLYREIAAEADGDEDGDEVGAEE